MPGMRKGVAPKLGGLSPSPRLRSTVRLDCSASLLTFGTWTTVTAAAATAFAAIAATTASAASTALSAVFAFRARFTAIFTTWRRSALTTLPLLVALPAAKIATISALPTGATASAATAAVATLTLVRFAPHIARGTTSLRRSRFIRLPAEHAFQPADESARLFLRLWGWLRFLIRLLRARLEPPLIAARLTWLETAIFAAAFTGLTRFARLVRAALAFARLERAALLAFATLTAITRWLECAAFIRPGRGIRGPAFIGTRSRIGRGSTDGIV